MSKASEAGRELLSPGQRYLCDEIEAMRKENAAAHTRVNLTLAKHFGELPKDTEGSGTMERAGSAGRKPGSYPGP